MSVPHAHVRPKPVAGGRHDSLPAVLHHRKPLSTSLPPLLWREEGLSVIGRLIMMSAILTSCVLSASDTTTVHRLVISHPSPPPQVSPPESSLTRRPEAVFGNFLVITSRWVNAEMNTSCIVGKIRNTSSTRCKMVTVTYNLYRGATLVGNAIDIVDELGPGEEWAFRANVFRGGATSCRVASVDGIPKR